MNRVPAIVGLIAGRADSLRRAPTRRQAWRCKPWRRVQGSCRIW